jgi:trafficking protein particle complex subunit 10
VPHCLFFSSHRGQLSNALTTYSSLPAHYAPHTWTSLESFMLSQALDTHADLNKSKDIEWIHVLLSYLRAYIDNRGTELLLHEADKVAYVTELVNGLETAVSELETGLCLISRFFSFLPASCRSGTS